MSNKCVNIYFDGASKGNPGEAGCGYCIEYDDIEFEGSYYIGSKHTNNEAEYNGLLKALEDLQNNFKTRFPNTTQVVIRGDSKLVIEQVSGKWQINVYHLKLLYNKCINIITNLKKEHNVSFKLEHIARNLNSKADHLANQSISDHLIL